MVVDRRKRASNEPSFRFVTEEKVLEIEVEPGVHDGYEIPFLAEGIIVKITPIAVSDGLDASVLLSLLGEPHIEGEPGDLKFIVRLQKYR